MLSPADFLIPHRGQHLHQKAPTVNEESLQELAPAPTCQGARVSACAWGWRHAGRRQWTLRDVSFSVEPGEKVLLLGASGSGKSTLMAGIAGILGGDEEGDYEGSLLIDGRQSTAARGTVGLVMQDPDAQVVLERVGDDVAFGCENLGIEREQTWQRVDEALRIVGADMHPLHSTCELSGGQKQRLALASVLAMRPRLVLLDEPTANLDPLGVREVRAATERVLSHTGATAIIVEHRIDVWADIIDRIIVVADGRIEADGPFAQVVDAHKERLRELGVWLPGDERAVGAEIHSEERTDEATRGGHCAGGIECALEVNDLSIGYAADAPIRTGINLSVRRGATTCIVGVNGCGKSTLALTLAGLLEPVGGQVSVAEDLRPDVDTPAPHQWASEELVGRVSMVFQESEYQFVESTVRAELEVGPRLAGLSDAETASLVGEYLDILGLTHLAGAHPMSLSGGEKRRLSVATVLISAPQVVIVDEPTFGQDRNSWKELVRLFHHAVGRGMTLIAVTHDEAFIEALADEVIDLGGVGHEGLGKTRSLRDHHPSGVESAGDACAVRRATGGAPIDRVNPVVQVLGVIVMTTPVVASVDVVTAGVALIAELMLLPFVGVSLRQLVARVAPLFVAAPLASVSMLLYGRAAGHVWWQWGPAIISDNSVALSASIFFRIFALALPVIVLFPRIDPTDMADGLTQIVRLPARPVIASLAAARMMGLMMNDWSALRRARRVRGVGDSRGARSFLQSAFALLVFALRRSAKLSITMEARGFGGPTPRTCARVSRLSAPDLVMVCICLGVPIMYISAAIHFGTFVLFGVTR